MTQYDYSVTVAPTATPVSLVEAKEHLRVQIPKDDTTILALIKAATRYVQIKQRRQLMPATYVLTLDQFPSGKLLLPAPPLRSITSIVYVDADGNDQTWDSDNYVTKTDPMIGYVIPAFGESYPSARGDTDSVTVTFVAGYATASDVPETTREAILIMLAHWYENRELVVVGTITSSIRDSAQSLWEMDEVPTQYYDTRRTA